MTHCRVGAVNAQWLERIESAYRLHANRLQQLLVGHYPAVLVEDALQEVFMRLLATGGPPGMAPEIVLSPAYLLVCVRRSIWNGMDAARKGVDRARRGCKDGSFALRRSGEERDPLHNAEPSVDSTRLSAAVDSLPQLQREAIRLMMMHDRPVHSGAPVAERDGNNIAARKHRAIARLRELLTDDPIPATMRSSPRRLGLDARAVTTR
ncbi:MAG: sigma-70 family RNA polymerase sigma factor [Phycisphaerales bacterium]|nr:sigma-70 family RNA polymerase sigma factor [Phycisphaerales bacterium]